MVHHSIDNIIKHDVQAVAGDKVSFIDKEGKVRIGTVRLKEIRCGKKGCTKCPHRIYAYAQYRVGKQVKEKYLGVSR